MPVLKNAREITRKSNQPMTDKPKSKRKTGRPSDYSLDKASKICDLIAQGMSLRSIEVLEGMPDKSTVLRWLTVHAGFQDHYARAREAQMDAMAEEILDIADDGSNDWMEKEHGDERFWVQNGEAMQRSKLRVEARKWLMSKLAAKKYGDRIHQVHTGMDGGAVQIEQISPLDEIEARLQRLSAREVLPDEPKPGDGRVIN